MFWFSFFRSWSIRESRIWLPGPVGLAPATPSILGSTVQACQGSRLAPFPHPQAPLSCTLACPPLSPSCRQSAILSRTTADARERLDAASAGHFRAAARSGTASCPPRRIQSAESRPLPLTPQSPSFYIASAMRAKRKNHLSAYSFQDRAGVVSLVAVFFALGFWISLTAGLEELLIYLITWGVSYLVIYFGTCAGCVYYGTTCPIPAEGECVPFFAKKKESSFGWSSLAWATLSYLLRISVPVFIVFRDRRVLPGILYGGVFALFWVVHLFLSGCPNCVNTACPFNPDFSSRKPTQPQGTEEAP